MSTSTINAHWGDILLPIARASIGAAWGRIYPRNESLSWLQEQGACFVTLTLRGELRGCIGTLEPYRTLLEDVKANAYAAAFRDPRFPPLTTQEFDEVNIEISLLSMPQPLQFSSEQDALAQLKPGTHGVIFEYGHHRSTFLPQVWEQLPDVRSFMAHLKSKAGLSLDFWSEDVKLSCYTVTKWKETDLSKTSH